jgi:hypothetical protein
MVEDFIGVVEINSIEKLSSGDQARTYKAKLNSIQTFKGEAPSSILVSGTLEVSYAGQ